MKNIIVLTGGGTMGHVSPNLALIPTLVKSYTEIHYIGSINGIEKTKIEEEIKKGYNITYHPIPTTKFNRTNWLKNLLIPFVLFKSINKSKKLLKEINPSAIFSKGGYVSVPVCIAGGKLNIPLVIHESDLSMGLANKISSKHATTICTTFPETAKKHKNGIWTGSPISDSLIFASSNQVKNKYNLNPNLKTILITGGSLGATSINNAILNILPSLVQKYNIIHLTGKGKKLNFSHRNYHQEEFSNDIGSLFKASDLVISRAGSNTIFELALLKKPMLLIPLSKKASRGDQIENANYFKSLKIANVLEEEKLINLEQVIDNTIKEISNLKENLNKVNFINGKNNLLNEIYKATKR